MYPPEDLAVLRRILELQDRTTIPDSERVHGEHREQCADGTEVVLSMGSPTQETAREWRAAWSEEVAGVNLDVHRTNWTPVGNSTSGRLRQTSRAKPTAADSAKRRDLLLRLRNLDGLVEFATIAASGEWSTRLDALAQKLHVKAEQLMGLGFLVRATVKGRSIARAPLRTREAERTSSEIPPAVLELLVWLRGYNRPVAVPELPPHLAGEDVLTIAAQRGFIAKAQQRYLDPETRRETAGPPAAILTPEGVAIASEARLREHRTAAHPPAGASTYTVAEVAEMAGVSNSTLNKYAKLAGVKTPPRGKRNHQYPAAAVAAILQAMIDRSNDRSMKAHCGNALSQLHRGGKRE